MSEKLAGSLYRRPGRRGARGAMSWVVAVKEFWTSLLSRGMMPFEKAVPVEVFALDKALVKVWRIAALL